MRETQQSSVRVRTNRGLLQCERTSIGNISVNMGEPLLHWCDVPLSRNVDTLSLPLSGAPTACSMGNPHCTFFVNELSAIDVAALGPTIEHHPLFPLKTNVHFVQILDRSHIRLRVWERGGGTPLGSGSCSCGAAVGGIRRGLLDNTVDVQCDGGHVEVRWDGVGGVYLGGPVGPLFDGEWLD
jgi:diaminopimelate epimerase